MCKEALLAAATIVPETALSRVNSRFADDLRPTGATLELGCPWHAVVAPGQVLTSTLGWELPYLCLELHS